MCMYIKGNIMGKAEISNSSCRTPSVRPWQDGGHVNLLCGETMFY